MGKNRTIEQRIRKAGVATLALALFCALPLASASAACSGPAGVAGDVLYNSVAHVPQYCDGSNWVSFVATPGNGSATGSCTGGNCDGVITAFITSADYGGEVVGGVSGADAKCQSHADTQSLGGTYYAWIADSTDASAPANRFDIAGTSLPIKLVNDTTLAADWAGLTSGTLLTNFTIDETGTDLGVNPVHTNVNANGTRTGTNHCSNWSSTTGNSAYGEATSNESASWTSAGATSCFSDRNLYCFEQETGTPPSACTNPAGNEGDLTFNRDLGVMQYCEGDAWVSIGTCSDYQRGAAAHWALNEGSGTSVADISGNGNNGTVSGAIWSTGSVSGGYGLNFDGTNDYVSAPDDNSLDGMEAVSVSAWVRLETNTNMDHVVVKTHSVAPWFSYQLFVDATEIQIQVYDALSNQGSAGSSTDPQAGVWYHLVGTYDGEDLRLYVNGNDDTAWAINTPSGPLFASDDILLISSTDQPLDGDIDDVRIYDRALTAAEIEKMYQEGLRAKMEHAKVGHWTLDETSGTFADSSVSGNNGTQVGGVTYAVAGKVGKAASFDGTDDVINLGDNYDFAGGSFSVCAWAKPNVGTVGYVVGKFETTTQNGFWLRVDSSPADNWSMGTETNPTLSQLEVGSAVTYGAWQHLCAVVIPGPGTTALYKNGEVIGTDTAFTATVDNARSMAIGNRWDQNRDFSGQIDDVRIYNRPLTADEVALLYSDTAGGYGCTEAGAITYNTDHGVLQYCNGSQWVAVGKDCEVVGSGLMMHLKLDETSGTNANDSTTYNRDGTLVNSPVWQASGGKVDGALSFNGTNQYMTVPNTPSFSAAPLTIAGWLSLDQLASTAGSDFWIMQNVHNSDPWKSWQLTIPTATTDANKLTFAVNSGLAETYTVSDAALTAGTWTHFAAVIDETYTTRLYIDGVQQADSEANTALLASDGLLSIGRNPNNTRYFDGLMDDLRIYNRALTTAEIQELAAMGVSVPTCSASGTQSFTTPTAAGTFDVTSDMVNCTFNVTIKGAGGGAGDVGTNGGGAGGGATFDFVPAATGQFTLLVGEGGWNECGGNGAVGGGAISIGGGAEGGEGGGGGASAIAFDGTVLAIAGGGGGVGGNANVGNTGKGGDPVANACGQFGDGVVDANGGCNGTGGTGGDEVASYGGDAGLAGATGANMGGAGYPAFNVGGGGSGSGACGAGGGGGGDDGGQGAGGGGYLNTALTANASVVAGAAGGSGIQDRGDNGSITLTWGP